MFAISSPDEFLFIASQEIGLRNVSVWSDVCVKWNVKP